MTSDNLKKRHLKKPEDCVFCNELETVHHLMFECVVANNIWELMSELFCVQIGRDYEPVARFCVSNSKNSALNFITSAAIWCL